MESLVPHSLGYPIEPLSSDGSTCHGHLDILHKCVASLSEVFCGFCEGYVSDEIPHRDKDKSLDRNSEGWKERGKDIVMYLC